MIEENGYGSTNISPEAPLAGHSHVDHLPARALYLALVAGDVVAKEVEDGTLRMILCRPVSRLRVGLLKYAACVLYTFVLVISLASPPACRVGLSRLGRFVRLRPQEHLMALYDPCRPLAYLGALPLLALSLISISSMDSCFPAAT